MDELTTEPLTGHTLDQWERDGWISMTGVLTPLEISTLVAAVEELTEWASCGGPGLHHFEATDAGPMIARSEKFVDVHQGLTEFVRGDLLGSVLVQLFGEEASIFKEKVNYKHPGGGGFAPHQDATAYRFADHHISVMVPLDPSTVASGCLYFAPGHRNGQMATDDRGRIADSVAATLDWRPAEATPGDMVFFDSYTPHYSDTNRTDRPRRAMYLTYNASSLGDLRSKYYADKEAEFDATDGTFGNERVRISVLDDFLGRPVS